MRVQHVGGMLAQETCQRERSGPRTPAAERERDEREAQLGCPLGKRGLGRGDDADVVAKVARAGGHAQQATHLPGPGALPVHVDNPIHHVADATGTGPHASLVTRLGAARSRAPRPVRCRARRTRP